MICILNDSEDIYCKNTNINKSFTKEGPFQKIDAFHNKLCGIGNDGSVICWDEFGTEISSNSTFQHTDIATHEDGYCALVEERLYCTSFTAVPFYPALLEDFLDEGIIKEKSFRGLSRQDMIHKGIKHCWCVWINKKKLI